MLFEVMLFCRNFFPVPGGCKSGTYKISDGYISLDFLQDGQFFLIEGSVFNDGVYQYPAYELFDEEFTGNIIPLAPPKQFLHLVRQIEDWCRKNEAVDSQNMSPYQSESFGGYSYTKATGSASDGGTSVSWKDAFRSRLNLWRCI